MSHLRLHFIVIGDGRGVNVFFYFKNIKLLIKSALLISLFEMKSDKNKQMES